MTEAPTRRLPAAARLGGLDRGRLLVVVAALVLALAAFLLPWYALGEYRPSGWQASWWPRGAVLLAVAAALAARGGAPRAVLTALAAAALGCVLLRLVLPPDFGFDFGGLEVRVTREAGAWVGLAATAAMSAGAFMARGRPPA